MNNYAFTYFFHINLSVLCGKCSILASSQKWLIVLYLCFRNHTSCSVLVSAVFRILRNRQHRCCFHPFRSARMCPTETNRLNEDVRLRMPYRRSSVRVRWLRAPSAASTAAACFLARNRFRLTWGPIQVTVIYLQSQVEWWHNKRDFLFQGRRFETLSGTDAQQLEARLHS